MKEQISFEEIQLIEQKCRQMRSEVIYESFATLFKEVAVSLRKFVSLGASTGQREGSRTAGPAIVRPVLLTENTGYGWRRIIAD